MKHTYSITGMTCNSCKSKVESTLNTIDGVINASVDLSQGKAIIEMANPIALDQLQNVLPDQYSILPDDENKVELGRNKDQDLLVQLKPLFLILGYILIASITLNYSHWNWSEFMLDYMGLFYIVFSFFKLLDLSGFSESFKMYDPIAKAVPSYGYLYPFIEVLLGLLFLTRYKIEFALFITLLILGITTIGVLKVLINKKTIQCACLGTVLKLPMTKATLIENSIMIIMAAIMLLKL